MIITISIAFALTIPIAMLIGSRLKAISQDYDKDNNPFDRRGP